MCICQKEISKINNFCFGQKISSIEGCQVDSTFVRFNFDNGSTFFMSSMEDTLNDVCVWLEDINGNFEKHIGSIFQKLIVKEGQSKEGKYTFYTIITSSGYLDFRWNGTSNGYYSEYCEIHFKK